MYPRHFQSIIYIYGFSLVRKVLLEDAGLNLDETYAPFERPLGEELLEPTKIYVKPVLEAVKSGKIAGMAHVTGGGFIENLPRMMPDGLGVEIDIGSWPVPPLMKMYRFGMNATFRIHQQSASFCLMRRSR